MRSLVIKLYQRYFLPDAETEIETEPLIEILGPVPEYQPPLVELQATNELQSGASAPPTAIHELTELTAPVAKLTENARTR